MYPTQEVTKIKQEPLDTSQPSSSNSPVRPEIQSQFIQIKIEPVDHTEETTTVQTKPEVFIKLEPLVPNIKTEPKEHIKTEPKEEHVQSNGSHTMIEIKVEHANSGNSKNETETVYPVKLVKLKPINARDPTKTSPDHIPKSGGYKCDKCGRTLKSLHTLRCHQIRGTGCKPKPTITCPICDGVFTSKVLYKTHARSHNYDQVFQCDECQTYFKHRSTLLKHLRVHTVVKAFSCPVCYQEFANSKLVKPHLSLHIGDKPFPCPLCKKTFTFKHNAAKHLLIHCREKVLTCDICYKTFPRESRLRYHKTTHTKDKPFSCDICAAIFSHKSNVLRHIIRKHPGLIKKGLYK